jgi:hypothetical protein
VHLFILNCHLGCAVVVCVAAIPGSKPGVIHLQPFQGYSPFKANGHGARNLFGFSNLTGLNE